jgi:hypothetical protein
MALLEQDGGTARPLLARTGADINQLRLQLMEALDRMPRAEGTAGEVHVSNDLGKLRTLPTSSHSARNPGQTTYTPGLCPVLTLEYRDDTPEPARRGRSKVGP